MGTGGVSGKTRVGWAVNERGVLSPIFKIFKSMGLQELTFPTTRPLDCLWEELSGSWY